MKLFSKIATVLAGFSLALGVGVATANVGSEFKEAKATTGSYTFAFSTIDDKTSATPTANDGSSALTASTLVNGTTYTFTADSVKHTVTYSMTGGSNIASVQTISNVYAGRNNSIKVAKGSADGQLDFTVVGEANLSIDSVAITAFGGDTSVKITVAEATAGTKTQNMKTSPDTYTYTYASAVKTVSITGGAGKTSSNKFAYIQQIVVNYTISDAETHSITTSTEGLTLTGDTSVIDGDVAEVTLVTEQKKTFTNLVVTGAGDEDDNWYLDENVVNILSVTDDVTINATIINAPITSIAVTGQKTSFDVSENFSFGGTVTGTYADYAPTHGTEVLDSDDYTVDSSAFQKGVAGTYNIVVSYPGAPSVNYQVTVSHADIYSKFSGALEEGNYVIVYNGKALKASISSSRFQYSEPAIVDNTITNPDESIVWKIEQYDSDYWTIYNEGVGKYAGGTSTKNQGALLAEVNDYAKWSASGDSTYEFENLGRSGGTDPNNKFLRENGTNGWACYASSTGGALTLYKLPDAGPDISNSRLTAGTVSASTGDTKWTLNGFQFEVLYSGDSEYTDVTSKTSFVVSQAVPEINADGHLDVTVTATYKTASKTSGTISATLTFVNLYSISRLYDISLNKGQTYSELVTFDGIYMGSTSNGLIVMNGEYGMLVYHGDATGYEIGETYLTVTGSLTNYNHLYEIADNSSLSVSVLTDANRKSHVATPSTYVVNGSESASTLYLANRKTSLSGQIVKIGSNTNPGDTATSGSNNSIYISVGGNQVILFLRSADATAEVAAKFVIGQNITVEGFTTYFESNSTATFEVLFTRVVEADASYHAANFAKDLLKLTKGVCNSSYDGVTDNGSALTSIWTTLAGADYWLKIQAAGESSTLVNGTADSSVAVPATDELIDAMSDTDAIAAALYRYDYCTAKYDLTNFMSRTLSVSFSNRVSILGSNNNVLLIVVISSITVASAIGLFFIIRRRKHN